MIVGVLEVELVGLVVAVLCGEFGLDLVEVERLELEPDHGSGRVLRENLVDLDPDLLAGVEFTRYQVIVQDLFGECLSHSGP